MKQSAKPPPTVKPPTQPKAKPSGKVPKNIPKNYSKPAAAAGAASKVRMTPQGKLITPPPAVSKPAVASASAAAPVPKKVPTTGASTSASQFDRTGGLTADDIRREVGKDGKVRYRNVKTGQFVATATGEEILEAIAKSAGKSAILSAGKKIPIAGAVIGALEAGVRKWFGDDIGAGIALGSGVASTLPGAGTAVSIAADITNLSRDVFALLHPDGLYPKQAYDEARGNPEKMKELKAFEQSIKAAVYNKFNELTEIDPSTSALNPQNKISLLEEELGYLQESSKKAGAIVQPERQAILQQQIQSLKQSNTRGGRKNRRDGVTKNTVVSTQNDSNISSSTDEDIGSAGMAFPIDDYSSFSLNP